MNKGEECLLLDNSEHHSWKVCLACNHKVILFFIVLQALLKKLNQMRKSWNSCLFQWHAYKWAKLSAAKAKYMTTINKIYILQNKIKRTIEQTKKALIIALIKLIKFLPDHKWQWKTVWSAVSVFRYSCSWRRDDRIFNKVKW